MHRYIIVSIDEGEVFGTNDTQSANELSSSEDYYVIDIEKECWLLNGRTNVIPHLPDPEPDEPDGEAFRGSEAADDLTRRQLEAQKLK